MGLAGARAEEPPRFALGHFEDADGRTFAGAVVGDRVAPVDDVLPGIGRLNDLLTGWDDNVRALSRHLSGVRLADLARADELRVRAPVEPRQVFQSGANYRTHVVELIVAAARERGGDDLDEVRARAVSMMDARADEGSPYVFTGLPSAICGPFDDVVLPATGEQHDWELELAAVIGRPTYRVSRADALGHVAGYCMVNDLTTRDRVYRGDMPGIGTDWLASKNAPTFLPAGPWLVPAAFVEDPAALRIRLSLNGQVMQDESTADMIFGVAQLIEHVSAVAMMLPGDLLLTGSPAGNGAHHGRYLRAGDVLEGTVTGLGTQRNRCVAATGVAP